MSTDWAKMTSNVHREWVCSVLLSITRVNTSFASGTLCSSSSLARSIKCLHTAPLLLIHNCDILDSCLFFLAAMRGALEEFSLETVLSGIHCHRCHDYLELVATVNLLPEFIAQHPKVQHSTACSLYSHTSSVCLSVCLYLCLSVCLSLCPSLCLSVWKKEKVFNYFHTVTVQG